MTIIKKKIFLNKYYSKVAEKLEPSSTADRNGAAAMKNCYADLQQVKYRITTAMLPAGT